MSQRLCLDCDSLNFPQLFRKSLLFDKRLDKWGEIKAKASFCIFCRLIVSSIRLSNIHEPDDDTRVKLGHTKTWKLAVARSNLDGAKREEHWSNQYDIQSHADKYSVEEKYCITVTAKSVLPEGIGFIQCLIDGLEENDRHSFLGRPVAKDQFHADLSILWLERCKKHHSQSCERPGVLAGNLPANFRIIDMEQKLVVPFPSGGCQYAVISYVWGEKEMSQPMPRSLRRHVRKDNLGREVIDLPQTIPATVADSMNVAMHIGFRYFWVDSFCIIQDDSCDKDSQIPHMDAVYSCAALTIAAGSSPNADYGVHGISRPREHKQESACIKGNNMAAVLPQFNAMDRSTRTIWNQRGWTLQEKVFSRRLLLFTDTQVFFKCKNSIWSEDIRMETKDLSQHFRRRQDPFAWVADRSAAAPIDEDQSRLYQFLVNNFSPAETSSSLGQVLNYVAIIEMYTRRSLSFHTDVLKAVHGILRTLNIGVLHEGIPSDHFRFLLLWHPIEYSVCTRADVALPSWTWAAYKFDRYCTWSALDQKVSMMEPKSADNSFFEDRTLDVIAEENDSRFGLVTANGYQKVGSRLRDEIEYEAIKKKIPEVRAGVWRWSTLLHLECEVQEFFLGPPIEFPPSLFPEQFIYHQLQDKHGFCLGEVLISPKMVSQRRDRKVSCLRLFKGTGIFMANIHHSYIPIKNHYYPSTSPNNQQNISGFIGSGTSKNSLFDALAHDDPLRKWKAPQIDPLQSFRQSQEDPLRNFSTKQSNTGSRFSMKDNSSMPTKGGEYSAPNFTDGKAGITKKDYFSDSWPIVHVMLVEWLDDDRSVTARTSQSICRRLAVGRIMMDAWVKARAEGGLLLDTWIKRREVFIA